MAEKRKRDTGDSHESNKKQKKGFSVGPANLPDGTYKRRVQKIKKNLIEKAKIKKDYAKIKNRDLQLGTAQSQVPAQAPVVQEHGDDDSQGHAETASLQPHPDRQAMLDRGDAEGRQEDDDAPMGRQHTEYTERSRSRWQKTNPYNKQIQRGEQLKAEAEQRRQEREAAIAERDRKREERERWRRQMAKARRPGKDGQRKLGRESKLLLERVQRLVGADGT